MQMVDGDRMMTDAFPEFFDLVGNVRAIRRLKTDPVPLELIHKVLNAGVQAPSGQNTQPWAFVLVSDPERKRWFADHYAAAMESRFGLPIDPGSRKDMRIGRQLRALFYQIDHMHEAPHLLLVCGERDWPFKVPEEERIGLAPPNFGAVYPCVQNILLACRAVGLGAALTTMHQVFEDELHEYFGIPSEYGVVVTMPIGWPMGKFGPVTRTPAEEHTHYDSW
jgi:nitroreductase